MQPFPFRESDSFIVRISILFAKTDIYFEIYIHEWLNTFVKILLFQEKND